MTLADQNNQKQFRISPIEGLIAGVLSIVFLQSLYQLLYQGPSNLSQSALLPMKAKPTSEGRRAASTEPSPLLNLELDCTKGGESVTQATKARLQGEMCGIKPTTEGIKLNAAVIKNDSNQFMATVFAQNNSRHFSTDYIPLVQGPNKIHVEFEFSGGLKPYSQDLVIIKN